MSWSSSLLWSCSCSWSWSCCGLGRGRGRGRVEVLVLLMLVLVVCWSVVFEGDSSLAPLGRPLLDHMRGYAHAHIIWPNE